MRKRGSVFVPVVLVFINVVSQHGNDSLIIAFRLPIRLGMICRRKEIRYCGITTFNPTTRNEEG